MRILWHSNAPWCNTGYGKQTALWTRLLRSLGHEVAISAFHGLHGSPIAWEGIPVYPGGTDPWGMDVVAGHYQHFGADLLITLMDVWVADPVGFTGLNVAHWTPVDCEPLAAEDRKHLEATGGVPVAMSRFGHDQMKAAGLDPLYVPHGIDTEIFAPPADRDGLRASMGLEGKFVIGINAANQDQSRKGFPEQFWAFSRFARKHPEAVLLVHSRADNRLAGGLDLYALARDAGIADRIVFADQYTYMTGMVGDEAMASWYGSLDVLSNCSWGEGFGLPVVEAQACGVPVVVTRASAMTELCGAGWMTGGEPAWIFRHEARWIRPAIGEIVRAYEQAFKTAPGKRQQAREFALAYDVRRVLREHWEPVLDALSSR